MKALISGGSKGIGRAIALRLANNYEVHTFARGEIQECLGHSNSPLIKHISGVDVRKRESFDQFDLSQYDCLVNNVGIAYDGILATQSLENIEDLLSVNLTSIIYLTKLYIRSRLPKRCGGNIVNISSIVGIRGYSGLSTYSATKAALDGFTRSLAREVGSKKFRINSVLPGYVETDLSKDLSESQKQQIIRRTPLGRLATTEDIAGTIEFLLSDNAKFITGQSIVVDGGITI